MGSIRGLNCRDYPHVRRFRTAWGVDTLFFGRTKDYVLREAPRLPSRETRRISYLRYKVRPSRLPGLSYKSSDNTATPISLGSKDTQYHSPDSADLLTNLEELMGAAEENHERYLSGMANEEEVGEDD